MFQGEALLRLLPDDDAKTLLQLVDSSRNNNAVVGALRVRVRCVEEDAVFQAEALLAAQTLVSTVRERESVCAPARAITCGNASRARENESD